MCSNCTCSPEAAIQTNIHKAITALVIAHAALQTAHELSEAADLDFAIETIMGEVEGLGVMLMENPDLSVLAESMGFTG